MIEIREVAAGYEVHGGGRCQVLADRAKAFLIAQLVALQESARDGRRVQIAVPMGFGESVLVSQPLDA